jgi:hypothetical protein
MPVRSQKQKDDPVDHASGVCRERRDIKIWVLRLLIGLRDYSIAFDCQSKIKEVNGSLGLGAFPLENTKVIKHEYQSLPLQVTFSKPDKEDIIDKLCKNKILARTSLNLGRSLVFS